MLGHALAAFLLASTFLSQNVSAGPHARGIRTVHRRHHHRSALAVSAVKRDDCDDDPSSSTSSSSGGDPATPSDSTSTTCSVGDWQCVGSGLQRCGYSNDWSLVQNCTGVNIACSASSTATGCVWAWSAGGSTNDTQTTIMNSTTNDTSADPTNGETDDCDDDDEPTSASTQLIACMTSSASLASATCSDSDGDDSDGCDDGDDESTAPVSPAVTATASTTAIGGALFGYGGSNSSSSASNRTRTTGTHHSANATSSATVVKSATNSSASDPWESATSTSSDGSWNSATSTSSGQAWMTAAVTSYPNWAVTASASSDGVSNTSTAVATGKHKSSATSSALTTLSTGMTEGSASVTTSIAQATQTSSSSSTSFSAPHYVIYADEWLDSMPSADEIGQYNRFILAFWMVNEGAVDDAQAWAGFSASTRQQVLDEYHNAGIALMVSAFGSTDSPTTNGADPTQTAQNLASWVKQYGLDGVDIDYEDMTAMNNNQAEAWLITFQTELRNQLPAGQYVISHAPVAPWFTSANIYASGAYSHIHAVVGDTIDWYNVQFYNQGSDQYVDCTTLLTDSGSEWPGTSVMEINQYSGVPLSKIVIGKPNDQSAADNGYMSPSQIATCVTQARGQGWNGGVMFWEWANGGSSLIASVLK